MKCCQMWQYWYIRPLQIHFYKFLSSTIQYYKKEELYTNFGQISPKCTFFCLSWDKHLVTLLPKIHIIFRLEIFFKQKYTVNLLGGSYDDNVSMDRAGSWKDSSRRQSSIKSPFKSISIPEVESEDDNELSVGTFFRIFYIEESDLKKNDIHHLTALGLII